MKIFNKTIYGFLSASVLYSTMALPLNQTEKKIKILTEKSDLLSIQEWNNYCSSLKNFFTTTNADNSLIHGYDIEFSYNNNVPTDKKSTKDYETYAKNIVDQLKSNNYDMMIVDDKFLFGDVAYIESKYIDDNVGRQLHEYYLDLTNEVSQNSLSFHDSKLFQQGFLDNHLYALPFEKDFHLLYYRNINTNINDLDMGTISWDDILSIKSGSSSTTSSYPLSVAYGNDDELLETFMEYVQGKVDISGRNNINFENLYNESSSNIYSSFKKFVVSTNPTETDINKLTDITIENAYNALKKDESLFFKGKASHFSYLTKSDVNNNISAKLPPKNTSVLTTRYLVINSSSLIDKKVLVEVALQLTSKEIQLYKAEQFGKIPTFDLAQKSSDTSIQTYSEKNSDISGFIEKLNPMYLKDIFSNKYSAPLLEIRALLPEDIRKYVKDGNDQSLSNVLENTKNLLMDKVGVAHLPTILLYVPIIIFALFAIVVIILIFKYRNHPYLKIFSPNFCILSILGITLNIISPLFRMEINSISKCKFIYVYETIYTDLTLFPMVAVTYRIYTIYHNKSKDIKNKNLNRRIYTLFIVGLLLMIIYSACSSFLVLKFFFQANGTIDTYRQPLCTYNSGGILEWIERRINEAIYIVMIFLIIVTGRISKKFGEFKYIYCMFFIGIMEYGFNYILSILPSNKYFGFYLLTIVINSILNSLLIYYLVGSRLIYCIKHPNDSEPYHIEELVNNNKTQTQIQTME
jgi:hypothetical protein